MILPGTALRPADIEQQFSRCGTDTRIVEAAYLRCVDSPTGAELMCRNGAGDYSGILFPYFWPGDKDRVRDYRLRLNNPELEYRNGVLKPKNRYLCPPGRAPMLYFSPDTDPAWLDDVSMDFILTEGEKKKLSLDGLSFYGLGDAADRPRWLAIAIPGVWSFRGKRGRTEAADGDGWQSIKDIIPDFDRIQWVGRKVILLFDSNVHTNSDVRWARHCLAKELRERGATVLFVDLPADAGVNGVDDLIGIWGHARVLKLIESTAYDSTTKPKGAAPKPADTPPERVLDIVTLSTVEAKQPEWLWQPYLPFGAITLLSGDPSAGKSWISLAIAAPLSCGRLLDGRTIEPCSTLYLTVENPLAEVLRGRFDSLGGDPKRPHVLRGFSLIYGDGSKDQRSITLKDVSMLDEAIRIYEPALVVIDPVQSYLGAEVDAHRANETRPVLDGLIRLTEKHHLATLIVRHLSKGVGGKALYRGMGSIDMTAAARSEILAGQLPDNPDDRAMVHAKPFTVTGASLGYRIAKDGSYGRFEWTGETSITANDLLCAPTPPSKLDEAKEFLKTTLAKGSLEQPRVFAKAEEEGISEKTLRRAKKILQIQSTRRSFQGTVLWEFPQPESAPNGKET